MAIEWRKLTVKTSLCMALVLTLSSCGSSSSGSPQTPTPTPTPAPTPAPPAEEIQLPLPDTQVVVLSDAMSPAQAIADMGVGINLGNTLDAPTEGEWALAAEEYYIQAFKDAGFGHVRVPITWGNHIQAEAPYTIDVDFLDRVEQIVDWVLDRDLYVIINVHHDSWIKENYDDISQRNRFDSIWMQVSERFKDKSAKLLFEIINEPRGLEISEINTLNQRALSIIRNQFENRIVVFAGNEWSALDDLFNVATPSQTDDFLIANFHNYDPWNFAGICVQSWGTEQDKEQMETIYQRAAQWSQDNQIPIMMNEFGVAKYDFQNPENECAQDQREDYLRTSVSLIHQYGLSATFWDDGGSFSSYDRANNIWGPEKDILVSQ